MKVKFKCLASGNVFEFSADHDIKTMRTHPGYQEVLETAPESTELEVKRQVGRPKKVTTEEE